MGGNKCAKLILNVMSKNDSLVVKRLFDIASFVQIDLQAILQTGCKLELERTMKLAAAAVRSNAYSSDMFKISNSTPSSELYVICLKRVVITLCQPKPMSIEGVDC